MSEQGAVKLAMFTIQNLNEKQQQTQQQQLM